MGNTVILAEKPSVARDIARVLGCRQQGQGYLAGNGLVVTWAVGHLVGLAQPHEINPSWKSWDLSLLPMVPDGVAAERPARDERSIRRGEETNQFGGYGRCGLCDRRWPRRRVDFSEYLRSCGLPQEWCGGCGSRLLRRKRFETDLASSDQARTMTRWRRLRAPERGRTGWWGLNLTRAYSPRGAVVSVGGCRHRHWP